MSDESTMPPPVSPEPEPRERGPIHELAEGRYFAEIRDGAPMIFRADTAGAVLAIDDAPVSASADKPAAGDADDARRSQTDDAVAPAAVSPAGLEAAETIRMMLFLGRDAELHEWTEDEDEEITANWQPAFDALDALLAVVASEREQRIEAETNLIDGQERWGTALGERDAERERADRAESAFRTMSQMRDEICEHLDKEEAEAVRLREALQDLSQEVKDYLGHHRNTRLLAAAREAADAALVPVAAPPEEPSDG